MKWIAVLALVLCAGCGGGGDDNGGVTPPPPPPPPTGIGTAGGTVTEASGAKVVIPSGALSTSTDIAIAQSAAGAPALPTGTTAFGPTYAFTPHGTTFTKPVTITVPFDPGKVPASTTPVLYKTNAARTDWEVVAGAKVSGAMMTADVTSFSNLVVGLPPTQLFFVRKEWSTANGTDNGEELSVIEGNKFGGDFGKVDSDVHFGTTLPFEDFAGGAQAFSTQDGAHYYVAAAAPHPGDGDDEEMHLAAADMYLEYTYRKNAPDATLKFTLSAAQLDTIDPRGVGTAQALCPWLEFGEESPEEIEALCEKFQVNPSVGFSLFAWSADLNEVFYEIGGEAEITGLGHSWKFKTHDVAHADLDLIPPSQNLDPEDLDSEVFDRVWNDASFDFSNDFGHDGGAQGHAVLHAPITITVPLADVPIDTVFTVESFAVAQAVNHVQAESEAFAYLRDPVDTGGGVKIEFTGLEQLPSQTIPATHKALHPCTGAPDPAAGQVQFSAPDFPFPELPPARGLIQVERVGGSTGEIGVRLETADGSALAASDYTPTRRVVWFHDGQDGVRTVSVPILLDAAEESTETVDLKLTVVSGCASLGSQATATLTIFDDDKPIPVTPTFSLGGTVTGLAGTGLHLQTNFINDVRPTVDGPFAFPRTLEDGTRYSVIIVTQPTNPAQICTLTNGSGTIAGANVTNVLVNCTTPPPVSGLDSSFGSGGKVFGTSGSARVLRQQADGKLLALGNLTLNRYNTDGTVDTAFGSAGKVDIATGGNQTDKMMALVVQPDGKIIVVGNTKPPAVVNIDFIVLRYNADGTPDASFGTGGKVVTDFDGGRDEATGVMLQSDGKIVVTGDVQIKKIVNEGTVPVHIVDQDFGAARYLPDGTLDASYGTGGKASLDVGGLDTANAAAMDDDDDSIVIVGRVTVSGGSGNPDMAIARFVNTGVPDLTFGVSGTHGSERIDVGFGVVPGSFDGGLTDEALDVAIEETGRILVGGYSLGLGNPRAVAALFRLSSTGAIEQNIGPIPTTIDQVSSIALQGDRKIVIAGAGNGDFALARFMVNGTPDTTFGSDGLLTVDFFGGIDEAQDVLVQSDGRIVAGGTARNGTGGGAGIVRVVP